MKRLDTKTPVLSFANWENILELGRYAPTPHNTQWYFLHALDEETAKIGIDNLIRLPHTDPDDQFRFTGLGVFVRHLELAAKAVGFSIESSFSMSDEQYPVVVRIIAKQSPNNAILKLIKKRQTSRLAYKEKPINDEAIEALCQLTDNKNSVHISTDKKVINSVLELNNRVLMNDLRKKGIGNELNDWIRYSKRAQIKYQNGFTPETLATPAWKVWLVFKFRHIILIGPLKKWLTNHYFKQNRTSTVGWIDGPLKTPQEQYDAGRFMMEVWMKVTEYGYYMQPYGSIITNPEVRNIFLDDIGQSEKNGNMVWLAFRIGLSSKPAQSPRKNIKEYLR